MFYDRYLSLCTAQGVAPTTVLSELGISKSAYTGWKSGAEPANRTKKQIADYFGMTVSELMSGGTIKAPIQEDERKSDLIDSGFFRVMQSAKDKGYAPEDIQLALDFLDRARKRDQE